MKHTPKSISDYMARLGKRKKRMSARAIEQRRAAGRRSGIARAKRPASETPLAQSRHASSEGLHWHNPKLTP